MQWYRTSHVLHWMSAAVCLAALLLFSVTGVTLNHASAIGAKPVVIEREARLPTPLHGALASDSVTPAAVPAAVALWIEGEFGIDAALAAVEWSEEELYLSAPGPGRDAWVSIDRATGAARFESTDRGWIAYFNDLHKGRNTGFAWMIFIDLVAVACVFFSITGLILLHIQSRQRKSSWPLVGAGVGLVVVLMAVFAH